HPRRDHGDPPLLAPAARGDGDHAPGLSERGGRPAAPAAPGQGPGAARGGGGPVPARVRLRRGRLASRAAPEPDPWSRSRRFSLAAADPAPHRGRGGAGRPGRASRAGPGHGMSRLTRAGIIGTALLLAAASAAGAQTKKDAADLGEKERALQQTQKRLKEERAKAAEARKREAGILSDLEAIDRRLNDKRKQVALLDGRIRRTQAGMSDLQQDIARLESRRAGQEDAMAQRLRAMYRLQVQGGALPV